MHGTLKPTANAGGIVSISGVHIIWSSTEPQADRAFLRDVLGLPGVDAGDGWLIFALPIAEIGVHPSDRNDVHELYLMTDDVHALVERWPDGALPAASRRTWVGVS